MPVPGGHRAASNQKQSKSGFAGSYYGKSLLASVLGVTAVSVVSWGVYSQTYKAGFDQVAEGVAREEQGGMFSGLRLVDILNRHHLDWYYTSGLDGKPDKHYANLAPQLDSYAPISRTVSINGQNYYEAVVSAGKNKLAHVGFIVSPLGSGPAGPTIPLYGAVLGALAIAAGWAGTYWFSIGRGLRPIVDKLNSQPNAPLDAELKQLPAEFASIYRLLENRVHAAKQEMQKELEHVRLATAEDYETQLQSARANIADYIAKEIEEKFVNKVARATESLQNSTRIVDSLLQEIIDEFTFSIREGFACRPVDGVMQMVAQHGAALPDEAKCVDLAMCARARDALATGNVLSVPAEEVVQAGLAAPSTADQIFFVPLTFHERQMGLIVLFFSGDQEQYGKVTRLLKKAADTTSRALIRVVMYEDEYRSNRTDDLTGVPNRRFMLDLLKVIKTESPDAPKRCAFMLIEGDGFMKLNEQFGRQAGDDLIRELAKSIRGAVRLSDNRSTSSFGDHIFKTAAAQFLIILEKQEMAQVAVMADRLRTLIDSKNDWPSGVPKWSISVAIAAYPEDGQSGDEVMRNLEAALAYVREQGGNKTINVNAVPREYRVKRLGSQVGGDLGVLDPFALLQSLLSTKKTGVLEVKAKDGSPMWLAIDAGKVRRAHTGKLTGDTAVLEFLTRCEEGEFSFRECALDQGSMGQTNDAFDVQTPLERLLLDGSRCRQAYLEARAVIPTGNMYINLMVEDMVKALNEIKPTRTPSREEIAAIGEIYKASKAGPMFSDLRQKLDHIPSFVFFPAIEWLLSHKIIRLSALRVYGAHQTPSPR